MAEIIVKGYANKPKTFGDGKYSSFTLSEKQKGRQGAPDTRNFYNVANFESAEAPPDGSFVTVSGYLNFREYEKNGVKHKASDITAKEIKVWPKRDGATESDMAGAKDPWD